MINISLQRIIEKLDTFFSKNDYEGAEKHILYFLEQAKKSDDKRCRIFLLNELAGLYRKLSKKENAFDTVRELLSLIDEMDIKDNIGAATSYINCATVYKAFGEAEEAMPLFEKARNIYEKGLEPLDKRLGGLYNNMALALVDLKEFERANSLYNKAINVMEKNEGGELEKAITLLNIASAKEAELGALDGEEDITRLLQKAKSILDNFKKRDGYYAFVCEKCASVFGYYGYFLYEKELKKRAEDIYEGA